MANINYTPNHEETEESFDVLPAGEYLAIIEGSDYTQNKKGTGMILALRYQVIDGPLKGRKIFENLNIENQNKQAEQISRKALNSITKAVGLNHVQDSAQLHNIPLKITVKVKDDETYGKQNNIKKHEPASSQPIQEQQSPAVVGQQPVSGIPPVAQPWAK